MDSLPLDRRPLHGESPPGGSAVGKKEIRWVPLIGWCFWAFRLYTIDRKNLERAKDYAEERRG